MFNLYVWFEVLLIASFVLMALGGGRMQIEGAFKYVALNLIASALFLTAVGLLYSVAGTLNMAELAQRAGRAAPGALQNVVAMLFLAAFGIKAAVFPLFFWLPASYHTPPAAVSALFSGLLTKVGVYALIRTFTLLFQDDRGTWQSLILWVSGLTMVTGVLGAVAQEEFRKILSFHIISQIGYMIMGLGLFTPLALAGSIFYIVHHIVVKTNLFLISGVVQRLGGSYELKRLGGVYRNYPWVAALFLVAALSLAGAPPLSGFFAKLALIQAGLGIGAYLITLVALCVGLLTLFSMTKIWNEAFWKPASVAPVEPRRLPPGVRWALMAPATALAIVTMAIGLEAESVFRLALRASEELVNPSAYIRAVMSGGR
jgi:multicomponent Na+:H+ antiporter subunit D